MKFKLTVCLTLCCFLLSGSHVVSAQKKKAKTPSKTTIEVVRRGTMLPPPPPVAVTVVDARLKEFVSDEGGFKIKFPGTPMKKTSTIDTAAGQISMTKLSASSSVATYAVAFMDFPAAVTDPLELKIRYDGGRDAVLRGMPGSTLIDEKDMYFGDRFGREFVVEDTSVTATYRVFLVQQRLFEIVVFTRRLGKAPEQVRNNYKKTIEDFFNSFVIMNIPAPKEQPPQFPTSFGVKIEDGNFTSEFFEFSIKLPENWHLLTAEEREFIEDSKNSISKKKSKAQEQLELSAKNSQDLLTVMKFPVGSEENSALHIIAERTSFANFVPLRILQIASERLYVGQLGLQVTKPVENVRLNGVEFARVGLLNPNNGAKIDIYMANRKGLALEFVLSYTSDADLARLESSLQTVNFKK
jgi:hypothetical protein